MEEIKVTDTKRIYLGGTGKMYSTKIDDKEYLFKPSINKNGTAFEPFRADIQEVGYKIQNLVDSDTAIPCFTGHICLDDNDKMFYGAFQERLDTKPITLKNWQYGGADIGSKAINELLRESITDYLLCNFDAHGGNFIMDSSSVIRGVDKEQALRYINDVDTKIDINYSPNTYTYGEAEPILHTILKRYHTDKFDIDFDAVFKYIDIVDSIDSISYMQLYNKYIKSLCETYNKNKNQKQELYRNILRRKKDIRLAFTTAFIDSLIVKKANSQSEIEKVISITDNIDKVKTLGYK